MTVNTNWTLIYDGEEYDCGRLPVSCLGTLRGSAAPPDFSVGENQYEAEKLARRDAVFRTNFDAEPEMSVLVLRGVDTVARVFLNGVMLGTCDNMHRVFAFRIPDGVLKPHENLLEVRIKSPVVFAEEAHAARPLFGVSSTLPGYQHIRKAHYMYGWDWGAVIPDMGIYGSLELRQDEYELTADVNEQFDDGFNSASVSVTPVLYSLITGKRADCQACAEIIFNGKTVRVAVGQTAVFEIDSPRLWFPNGYGEQPLYELRITTDDGRALTQKIGLREIKLCRDRLDDGGREFCISVNGKKIFSRGANYIPQDNIIPDITDEKIRLMLADMKDANFCMVRVWGGGYYPGDFFYDCCDEMGLLVWQDFMFACAVYDFDDEALEGIYREACDTILRIKNHASLALLGGNNELEEMWETWGVPDDSAAKECYFRMFGGDGKKGVIQEAIDECGCTAPYWPSSPSRGGGIYEGSKCFEKSYSVDDGDSHYWQVWHGFKPIEAFKQNVHRFCSEFGFESLPDYKTVRFFTGENEPNLCSNVMEAHQKCELGNEKLMFYMANVMLIPRSVRGMIYASQAVQADCIRTDVEHLRRHRGASMGALFWQYNDCAPMISWSCVDYFGNKKGLYHYSRRFFSPLLVSCDTSDIENVTFNASSELTEPFCGTLKYSLRDVDGHILLSGEKDFTAPPLSAVDIKTTDMSKALSDKAQRRTRYLEFFVFQGGALYSRGVELFVYPREFAFRDTDIVRELSYADGVYSLTLSSDGFIHAASLTHDEYILDLSDNWFDILPGEPVTVRVGDRARTLSGECVELTSGDIGNIRITHCGNYINA